MILTSPDGLHWTSENSGTGEPLSKVTYGNGTFVTVGANSAIEQSLPGPILLIQLKT